MSENVEGLCIDNGIHLCEEEVEFSSNRNPMQAIVLYLLIIFNFLFLFNLQLLYNLLFSINISNCHLNMNYLFLCVLINIMKDFYFSVVVSDKVRCIFPSVCINMVQKSNASELMWWAIMSHSRWRKLNEIMPIQVWVARSLQELRVVNISTQKHQLWA